MRSVTGRAPRGVLVAAAALSLLLPSAALASSGGIASTAFGLVGCPLCHGGGAAPTVVLNGPTVVTPGHTYPYTLTIFGTPLQAHGGLNVSAPEGMLSLGGPFPSHTRVVVGLGGRAEITHSAPKPGDLLNTIEFSFAWTAPADFDTVTLSAWGNAVDLSTNILGDNAAFASLAVHADVALPPTATPSPTPTPIGGDPCGEAAPPDPSLVIDKDSLRCQAATAKAGILYLKQHLKAAHACLKRFQAGGGAGDGLALCAGTAALPPVDPVAAAKLAKAEAKVRALLRAKCSIAAVGGLGLCAATPAALADCVLAAHRLRARGALDAQYGAAAPLGDKDLVKCQLQIAKAAAQYLSAHQRASQKCLAARNKNGAPTSGAGTLCVGGQSGGVIDLPDDPKTQRKVGTALAKLADKIDRRCTDAQIDALPLCGDTRTDLVRCLTCSQTRTVLDLIGDEFGGW